MANCQFNPRQFERLISLISKLSERCAELNIAAYKELGDIGKLYGMFKGNVMKYDASRNMLREQFGLNGSGIVNRKSFEPLCGRMDILSELIEAYECDHGNVRGPEQSARRRTYHNKTLALETAKAIQGMVLNAVL